MLNEWIHNYLFPFPAQFFSVVAGLEEAKNIWENFCFHLASSSLLVLPVPSVAFAWRGKNLRLPMSGEPESGTGNLAMLKGHSETGQ